MERASCGSDSAAEAVLVLSAGGVGSARTEGSAGACCAGRRCAPDEALDTLIGWCGEESGGVASLRFLALAPALPLLLAVVERGGWPTACRIATLRPAVGGKPSGLYCVPASAYTYPAPPPVTAPPSMGRCCCLCDCCCGRGEESAGALNARRGELEYEGLGDRAAVGERWEAVANWARGLEWRNESRGDEAGEGELVRVVMLWRAALVGRIRYSKPEHGGNTFTAPAFAGER